MMATEQNIREAPPLVSRYTLTKDGPVDCDYGAANTDVYICSHQLPKLWDPEVISYILERYGANIAVLHYEKLNTLPRPYPTFKMILG